MKIFDITTSRGRAIVAFSVVVLLAIVWLVTATPGWAFMALGLGAGVGLAGMLSVAAVMALGGFLCEPPHLRHTHRPERSS